MKQSQLKLLSELLSESDNSINQELSSDTLILKIQKNELYVAFALIGLLFSALLLYFQKRSEINLALGMFALVWSIITLIDKQAPNKTLIFNASTNSLLVIPSFFLNKLFLKASLKSIHPISFKEISEIKINYGFSNNRSRWALSFNQGSYFITLFSFNNKEKANQICNLLNEMRT
jgi:hypothetical protein